MIKMIASIPPTVDLAFSGGIDSLAVAHFLGASKKNLRLWHFNHGCEYSDAIEDACRQKAEQLRLPIVVGKIESVRQPHQSKEEHWRQERYKFLRSSDRHMMTAHHLDDAVETWIWSSLHGEGKIIPVQNGSVIRPFVLTSKHDFEQYGERHQLEAVNDPYNKDTSLMRNYMRENIMPHIPFINPGIAKVIRKKYLQLGQIAWEPLKEAKDQRVFKI